MANEHKYDQHWTSQYTCTRDGEAHNDFKLEANWIGQDYTGMHATQVAIMSPIVWFAQQGTVNEKFEGGSDGAAYVKSIIGRGS